MLLNLPAWTEILVNVIGYAGFIIIATWHANFRKMKRKERADHRPFSGARS